MPQMSNPWLDIPLADYEGHMSSAGVRQLTALAELFDRALTLARPESVTVLGVAGGNGLEKINQSVTKRIVGVDINQQYLDEVQRRFSSLAGLELHCLDLAGPDFSLAPTALVHAALIFEHTGLDPALQNALSLVAPGGRFSVVLQLPCETEQGVSATNYPSIQKLKHHFELIDTAEFQHLLQQAGFHLIEQEIQPLPSGKALCFCMFENA